MKGKSVFFMSVTAIVLLLDGCAVTSDVKTSGDGAYRVTSMAAPVRGGSIGASRMSMEKASDYCVSQGKQMVRLDQESKLLNSFGAGGASLDFKCVAPITDREIESCGAASVFELVAKKTDQNTAAELKARLLASDASFSFSQLTNLEKPTEIERTGILAAGKRWDECDRKWLETLEPTQRVIGESVVNKELAVLANLAAGRITYGEYAAEMNTIGEQESGALLNVYRQNKIDRQIENERQLRAGEKMGQAIEDAFKIDQ
jgi:hypothetical protein